MRKSNCLILLLIVWSNPVWSQWVHRTITFTSDTLFLDEAFIQVQSLQLKSKDKEYKQAVDYIYLPYSKQLVNKRIQKSLLLELSYLKSTYPLNQKLSKRTVDLIQPEIQISKNPFLIEDSKSNLFFNTQAEGIQTTGNIMRGFVFGNGMNANVNSNLNLQLSGKLQNEVNLLAAISDDNNPIQPEGNTRDVQDFDKVFVQFSKDAHQVLLGDYLMAKNDGDYFLNYYKKSRGLHVGTSFLLNKKTTINAQTDLAISRGRFVRNNINGIEGNQGPYRLKGPNGELFIIVISGTEAVYLNGERLTRGEQNDYTIDYNSGEITFMPKRLIQTFSRIVVEFQYSDRNYARTLYNQSLQLVKGNSSYSLKFYAEQDNKNQPFQQALSASDIEVLKSVGNQTENALVSGVNGPLAFNSTKVQYLKKDSLGYSNIFIYTNTSSIDTIFYELKFSYVGANKGNYVQGKSFANGRVFQWVAPLNAIPQGDFEPVVQLIAPNQKQLLTAAYQYLDAKGNRIQFEIAGSNDDKNTFSEKDNAENLGLAMRLQAIQQPIQLPNKIQFNQQINAEYTSSSFNAIERFRSVEFARNWQRQLYNSTANQVYGDQLFAYSFGLDLKQFAHLSYKLSSYQKNENQFKGLQHEIASNFKYQKWLYTGRAEWINSSLLFNTKNNSVSIESSLKKEFKPFTIAYQLSQEKSLFTWKNDSLAANSFGFTQHQFLLQSKDTVGMKSVFSANFRTDESPMSNQMKYNAEALDLKTNFAFVQNNNNQFNMDISYRSFKQSLFHKNEQTLLARFEYDYGFWKRLVTANSYFQTAGANELKRDYQFVEVPIGQGVYVWKDFNQNGLAELNEFLSAGMAEKNIANYIKVFLPSSSLVPVQSNLFNQTLNIHHFTPFKNNWFYKFSNQTAYKFDQKKLNTGDFSLARFLPISAQDTQLMSMNTLLRNTLFYNKTTGVFGIDYTYMQNQTKYLQTNGFDYRMKQEHQFNVRYNLNETWTLQGVFTNGNKKFQSNWLNTSNYDYNYVECKPKLNYQYKQFVRLSVAYAFTQAQNHYEQNSDAAVVHDFSSEARWAIPKSGTIFCKYSFINVTYDGNTSTVLAYEILQGLTNGKNQIWTMQWQHRIGSNIQINFIYDGRISANLPVVHIGKMEARYIF